MMKDFLSTCISSLLRYGFIQAYLLSIVSLFFRAFKGFMQTLRLLEVKGLYLKKKQSFSWVLVLAFFPVLSEAAGELSSWVLFTQVFNFSIFCLSLFLLVRKPIKLLCHQRQKDFFSFEKQSFELEKQKKEEYKLWENKLSDLKKQEKNIHQKAQEEGDRFYAMKERELKELEERLKKHLDFLLHLETEKLKQQQLDYWKKDLLESSKKELLVIAKEDSFQKKEKQAFIDFLTHHKKEA